MNQETKGGKQENITSPPSLSSSPSHEFSFTVSLHHAQNESKSSVSSIDLSPADEIFFHGHLLPLHLISHLPRSPPRASTNSLDNFTLPITQPLHDHNPNNKENSENGTKGTTVKPKSFSLFGLPKWRKGCEVNEKDDIGRCKKKPKFDVSYLVKKYTRALMSFRGRKSSTEQYYRHQSYSCSDFSNSRLGGRKELLRGRFSAPASMRTSPTNSGLIAAKESVANYNTSDSTMEELQAAIQAAIVHCKNSVSTENKINS
jgi:BRI1 kinase inhibitor 1